MKLPRLRHLALLGWLLWLPVGAAMADLVVVVNARNGVAVLTRNEVANIFFGRYRQFFNGVEAQPVDLIDGSPERAHFYAALVGKDVSDVNAYWSRQVFSGRMQPPPRLSNAEEVLKWVSSHPGGIGFVDLAKADARVRVVYEFAP
ncbi:MAG: phosphate ABC transporter substrate-binding protein [Bacteroidota bacterium]